MAVRLRIAGATFHRIAKTLGVAASFRTGEMTRRRRV
jgi:hypothetical protein